MKSDEKEIEQCGNCHFFDEMYCSKMQWVISKCAIPCAEYQPKWEEEDE